jgi:hypothetical protein
VDLLFLLRRWTEYDTLKRMLLRLPFDGIVDGYFPWPSEATDYVLPEKPFEPCYCNID